MAAGKPATTQRRTTRKRRDAAEQGAPAAKEVARPATRRTRKAAEPSNAATSKATAPKATTRKSTPPKSAPRRASGRSSQGASRATRARRAPAAPPPAAPCLDLERLQSLTPEAARDHVERYLYDVMSADDAGAFEAASYRWELHFVEIEQLRLVRGVDLDRKKLRRYRDVLKRGGAFPALIGLGGDGSDVTRDVLLCDGYHRAAAMRDHGVHYVWVWLATSLWQAVAAPLAAVSASSRD